MSFRLRFESARGFTLTNILLYSVVPVLLLMVWEFAVRVGWWPKTLIASPLDVIYDLWQLLISGQLIRHTGASLFRLFSGFLIGTITGVLFGSWIGLSKLGEKLLSPTFQVLAPIPPVAWIPLLIITLGIGEGSKIALIAIGAFFVIFVNTVQGIRGTDQKLTEVALLYEKSHTDLTLFVLLPSAAPNILTGMRVALGLSWVLLIAAEVIASSDGLGWLIWDARNFSRPDDMLVGMLAVGILGKISDSAIIALQKYALRWYQGFKGV